MGHSVSYTNDIYIVLLLMLSLTLIFGYFYFTQKLKELQKTIKTTASKPSSMTQAKSQDPQETIPQTNASFQAQKRTSQKHIPPIIKNMFDETKGITLEDFYKFRGTRLLIVEDNKINQKILLSVLKRSGIIIKIANNGKEALDSLNREYDGFDLVLMDISMPVMDGYTTTIKIREDKRFDALPIVTFTAFAIGKEIEKMFELGVNGYMTKPLNNQRLYTMLNTFLGHIEREVPLNDKLYMEGLDIEYGIKIAEGDIKHYKQALREFVLLNSWLIEAMPRLIQEKNYEHIRANCIKLSSKLSSLGAYELDEMIARMKKLFIYNTQHRVIEYKETFPETLQKLINAMKTYIEYPV